MADGAPVNGGLTSQRRIALPAAGLLGSARVVGRRDDPIPEPERPRRRLFGLPPSAAQVEPSRQNGMHALRHHYASVLLDAGESIKALSEYLGNADPGFTLRTYTHLMPSSEARTRKAVDRMLRGEADTVDGLATS